MIRRRRRPREIPFSLDSFLDVVANVVGIIIRLILVAWVGARSYTSLSSLAKSAAPAAPVPAVASLETPTDPLEVELARHRQELLVAQAKLLEHLRLLPPLQAKEENAARHLAELSARRQELAGAKALLEAGKSDKDQPAGVSLSMEDLRRRSDRIKDEMAALEKESPAKQVLRYRAPISAPVHNEQLHFECRGGKVVYIDMPAFKREIEEGLKDKGERLRSEWQIEDVTGQIGPFRLRYVVARGREGLEALGGGGPARGSGFSYGVTTWTVEPVTPVRGEMLQVALTPGSEFRQVADSADARQTVATFYVYPDSFAVYRQLRDYLYERGMEVAGWPLRPGESIRFARHGWKTRSQ